MANFKPDKNSLSKDRLKIINASGLCQIKKLCFIYFCNKVPFFKYTLCKLSKFIIIGCYTNKYINK